MKLFTKKQYKRLQRQGSPMNRGKDFNPVVKLVLPGTRRVWLLTEIAPELPDMAFGLFDLGVSAPKMGYIDLKELRSLKSKWDDCVERDVTFKGIYPLSIYAKAAQDYDEIIDNGDILIFYLTKNIRVHEPL